MTVALCATAIVVLALLWEVSLPWMDRRMEAHRARKERRAAVEAVRAAGLSPSVQEEETDVPQQIGRVTVVKVESKGKANRRVRVRLSD